LQVKDDPGSDEVNRKRAKPCFRRTFALTILVWGGISLLSLPPDVGDALAMAASPTQAVTPAIAATVMRWAVLIIEAPAIPCAY